MSKRKIIADSSANLMTLDGVDFESAPMKIITADKEFVDDQDLDLDSMVDYFSRYKGRSQTSCPNTQDWLNAFGDADEVFCIAITSNLSGSYNAACTARDMYVDANPGKRVFVIDSLFAGPELTLIAEKLRELILSGKTFDEICACIQDYQKKTGLLFSLESLNNFAANGRVSPALAKIAGVLGIRIVGRASNVGTLEPMDKCRGESKALHTIVKHLKSFGLNAGKVHIAHCRNANAAVSLKDMICAEFPGASVTIGVNLGLCSFYAEHGGVLVGFEKF